MLAKLWIVCLVEVVLMGLRGKYCKFWNMLVWSNSPSTVKNLYIRHVRAGAMPGRLGEAYGLSHWARPLLWEAGVRASTRLCVCERGLHAHFLEHALESTGSCACTCVSSKGAGASHPNVLTTGHETDARTCLPVHAEECLQVAIAFHALYHE